jgi:hypothetical protein
MGTNEDEDSEPWVNDKATGTARGDHRRADKRANCLWPLLLTAWYCLVSSVSDQYIPQICVHRLHLTKLSFDRMGNAWLLSQDKGVMKAEMQSAARDRQ